MKRAELRKNQNSFSGREEQSVVDQYREQSTAMESKQPDKNSPAQRQANHGRHFTNAGKNDGIHYII